MERWFTGRRGKRNTVGGLFNTSFLFSVCSFFFFFVLSKFLVARAAGRRGHRRVCVTVVCGLSPAGRPPQPPGSQQPQKKLTALTQKGKLKRSLRGGRTHATFHRWLAGPQRAAPRGRPKQRGGQPPPAGGGGSCATHVGPAWQRSTPPSSPTGRPPSRAPFPRRWLPPLSRSALACFFRH